MELDKEANHVHLYTHLYSHKNFFKRLWAGLRFAFGHRSRFGEWDSFILEHEDCIKLYSLLDTAIEEQLIEQNKIENK